MKRLAPAVFFDKYDYELLTIVNEVLDSSQQSNSLRSLLEEHMHPQGIKEMAAPRGLRIAYAIASLLGSFEKGSAHDRIRALRSLRDEVLASGGPLYRRNTARVLVQIMKELIRARHSKLKQLKLAHDFRMVSTGNPRLVRAQLAKYHLLEMPEEWNQYAFDDHVHDANTKGRKSPTHLVMDAWLKGIRFLSVVYYNYVNKHVVQELLEAAAILDVKVQTGIEYSARFRGKYVRFTWEPHGFNDDRDFLKFLDDEAIAAHMQDGKEVSAYQQRYVFQVLEAFNVKYRPTLNEELGLELQAFKINDFLKFVGSGQPSLLHLARFIQETVLRQAQDRYPNLSKQVGTATGDEKKKLQALLELLNRLDVEKIISEYLAPWQNQELRDPGCPADCDESDDIPELLRLDPQTLIKRLLSLHSSSRFILNLSNVSVQDTLELLYTCEGMITHIEAYNLKDAVHGVTVDAKKSNGHAVALKSPYLHYALISDLQRALNRDNVISLKRVVRAIIWDYEERRVRLEKQLMLLPDAQKTKTSLITEHQGMGERKTALLDILFHLEKFHNCYKKRTLGSRIGSSSTGQVENHYGMGLVVIDTLPPRAQKAIRQGVNSRYRVVVPVTAHLTLNKHRRCHEPDAPAGDSRHGMPLFPGAAKCQEWDDWTLDEFEVHPGMRGNVATLGGVANKSVTAEFLLPKAEEKLENRFHYLNTHLKNSLKVLGGFIPAFFTFFLTKDWWLLAYFGAVIWFSITGFRNILQSVLGGGGLRRSPLLPWNSLVSWSRIADSLLYTGFSVPLLDFLVKNLLLAKYMGITTATNPVMLYAVMGLANGIYISSHNIFRGLPRSAAYGNFFRSILAIPLAVLLNSLFGSFLGLVGVVDVSGMLQKWAAIISKLASDCVAAGIEGIADRQVNIRARLHDYEMKIAQLFEVFSRLDLMFPEEDVLEILQSPKIMMETLSYEAAEQERFVIVNALDLMYFWMYQPRSRKALAKLIGSMTSEEWLIFFRSQLVLNRYQEISQVFVDGLVGKNFSKALSFYLARYETYLRDLETLGAKRRLP